MQAANRLQKALRGDKPSFGGWQMLPGSNLSRVIARTPQIDWICVDCEHGNISDADMHESVAAIAACGVSPVVRVPDGQHWMIKRALDAGAHGIIIPLLQTVEDAKNIVKFSKFPPQGNRGLGGPFAMEKFFEQTAEPQDISLMQYYKEANTATVVIVQIETASALEQIKEIAAVPGIDVCFIGPVDLGNSIGHPAQSIGSYPPELEDAIKDIHKATQDAGKFTAIYTAGGESAKDYAKQGFNMIVSLTLPLCCQVEYEAMYKSTFLNECSERCFFDLIARLARGTCAETLSHENTMNDVAAIKMTFGQAMQEARQ